MLFLYANLAYIRRMLSPAHSVNFRAKILPETANAAKPTG